MVIILSVNFITTDGLLFRMATGENQAAKTIIIILNIYKEWI